MSGLLKIQVKQTFVHGLMLVIALSIAQLLLDFWLVGFLVYNPPIGFALFILFSYVVVPLLVGALNVFILHWLYGFEGWITEFWINGVFLLLVFNAVNLIFLTVAYVRFSIWVALVEILCLSFPLGILGKISNGRWGRKQTT